MANDDDRAQRNDPHSPDGQAERQRRGKKWLWWFVIANGIVVIILLSAPLSRSDKVTYSTLLTRVRAGEVDSVELQVGSGDIDVTASDGSTFSVQGPPGGIPDADIALFDQHNVSRDYVPEPSNWFGSLALMLLPVAVLVGLFAWMGRRAQYQLGGLSSFGRSKVRIHKSEQPSTTLADIAGYDAVKQEIGEVVGFLRQPEQFSQVGARTPKGLLLVGPPGTGKTLFAKAIAGEAQVPFLSITGSEFLEMFVGVGAARVRDLFETARKQRPCIVFVDEIDAIGRKRGAGLGGGHDEREQALNQLLAEMDGFESTTGIVVLAATNRPDILDAALLRAGRFDRQIVIPLPTQRERAAILAVHCRDKPLAADVDFDLLARGTPGMSGAELANLVNEAALTAVRRGAAQITARDFDTARDRVLMGIRRTSLALGDDERQIIAHHEAGHALLAYLLPSADPVHKVTILPTGLALGATHQLPLRDRYIHQRSQLEDTLAVRLGGRAAEQLVFGMASSGAHDDLVTATDLARTMVREWGMSGRLGHMAWGSNGPVFLGEDLVHTRDYSDETARVIDEETTHILEVQADRAYRTLEKNRTLLDAIAGALIEHETLTGDQIEAIVEHTGRVGHHHDAVAVAGA
jgi:cell division protease FtsH